MRPLRLHWADVRMATGRDLATQRESWRKRRVVGPLGEVEVGRGLHRLHRRHRRQLEVRSVWRRWRLRKHLDVVLPHRRPRLHRRLTLKPPGVGASDADRARKLGPDWDRSDTADLTLLEMRLAVRGGAPIKALPALALGRAGYSMLEAFAVPFQAARVLASAATNMMFRVLVLPLDLLGLAVRAHLLNKCERVRGLNVINGGLALLLVLAVVEAVVALAALAEQARAEANAVLPHTLGLLALAQLARVTWRLGSFPLLGSALLSRALPLCSRRSRLA
mmetsp:Transcript_36665/g.86240  ORF Transcript_36665/g.86240 Transcript_36665/m.86240 type:complete len:278 (-) Transcript_36665:852-1685(-)